MALSITFSAPGGSVTVNKGATQETRTGRRRGNTHIVETMGYDINGYSSGPLLISGVLVIKHIRKIEADNLISFFSNTITFVKPFTITPYSQLDLGRGEGIALTSCYVGNGIKDTNDLLQPMGIGGKWKLELPFDCRALIGVGLGIALD